MKVIESNKMDKKTFLSRKTKIEKEVEEKERQVEAFKDQRIAELYLDSGWTVREIAEVEGCSKSKVDQMLRFARFLHSFVHHGGQTCPKNLTERRFREYWEETEKRLGDAWRGQDKERARCPWHLERT